VKTVVLGPRPKELEALIFRRQSLGLDTFDEVWERIYHVAPAAHPAHGYVDHALAVLLDPYANAAGFIGTGPFNLGGPDDYRVPDQGYHRRLPQDAWVAAVAIAVEVVSPDDETYAKFGFYAAHDVEELIVADPKDRLVRCFRLIDDGYVEAIGSALLSVTAEALTDGIGWPRPTS
jgi:Uma2 family endonuclease